MLKTLSFILNLLIVAVIAIILSAGVLAAEGITFSILWGWFVSPLFHLPQLLLTESIGLWITVKFLLPIKNPPLPAGGEDEEDDDIRKALGVLWPFLPALIALGIGAVVRFLFM